MSGLPTFTDSFLVLNSFSRGGDFVDCFFDNLKKMLANLLGILVLVLVCLLFQTFFYLFFNKGKKKYNAKKLLYILIIRQNLIKDLAKEIGMKKKEASEIVDFALQLTEKFPQNYLQLKDEIKAYIIINMVSLVTKFNN